MKFTDALSALKVVLGEQDPGGDFSVDERKIIDTIGKLVDTSITVYRDAIRKLASMEKNAALNALDMLVRDGAEIMYMSSEAYQKLSGEESGSYAEALKSMNSKNR